MTTADGSVLGVTKIVDHGPASSRWNLVVVSEGYRSTEMTQFHADATDFARALFQTPPFDELWCGLNVYRIDVTSTDSGADDPTACGGSGATPATYFDATFCGDGKIRRLLTVNGATVNTVVGAQLPQAHMTLVMVNSTIYGGSGGGVAVFSRASGANEIALHEMGHTAFGLADEYEYYAGCGSGEAGHDTYAGGEPGEPNVTKNTNRATIKWGSLIAPATPLPTTANADCTACDPQPSPVPAGTVGAFEGAKYFHCGLYRPEFNCRMRALGQPYCAVCSRKIRQTLAPYLSSWTWGTNTLAPWQTQRWWLWWPGYPGLEEIGVQPMTAGAEIQFTTPGMQMNSDGSTTYFVSITNTSAMTVQYHFRGSAV